MTTVIYECLMKWMQILRSNLKYAVIIVVNGALFFNSSTNESDVSYIQCRVLKMSQFTNFRASSFWGICKRISKHYKRMLYRLTYMLYMITSRTWPISDWPIGIKKRPLLLWWRGFLSRHPLTSGCPRNTACGTLTPQNYHTPQSYRKCVTSPSYHVP